MSILERLSNNGVSVVGTSLVLTNPGSLNDLLMITYTNDSAVACSTPTDFNVLGSITHSTDTLSLQVFWGTSTAGTITLDGFTGEAEATITAIYDDSGPGTFAVSSPVVNTTSVTTSALGPLSLTAPSYLWAAWVCDSASTVNTPPAGMSLLTESPSTNSVSIETYGESISVSGDATRTIVYSIDAVLGMMAEITFTPDAVSGGFLNTNYFWGNY